MNPIGQTRRKWQGWESSTISVGWLSVTDYDKCQDRRYLTWRWWCLRRPTVMLVSPLFQSCNLDSLARRCSRKRLNWLKHASRERGCVLQYAIVRIFSIFTLRWYSFSVVIVHTMIVFCPQKYTFFPRLGNFSPLSSSFFNLFPDFATESTRKVDKY